MSDQNRFYSGMLAGMLLMVAASVACHHAAVQTSAFAAPCFSAYPPPPAGTIRIDGPGAFGPHANDSLVVRVDGKERWSGMLQSCSRGVPGLSIDFGPWQPAGDTLEVTAFERASRNQRPIMWLLQLATRPKKQR
jgi:hypothetical protein